MSTDEAESKRLLELELKKVQTEASAARLEARAVEIELMMRKLRIDQPKTDQPKTDRAKTDRARTDRARLDQPQTDQQRNHDALADTEDTSKGVSVGLGDTSERPFASEVPRSNRFSSWESLRQTLQENGEMLSEAVAVPVEKARRSEPNTTLSDRQDGVTLRHDPGHGVVGRPKLRNLDNPADDETDVVAAPLFRSSSEGIFDQLVASEDLAAAVEVAQSWDPDPDSEPTRQRSPVGLLVSAVGHVAILLLLAAIGMSTHQPKDQIALSATATSTSEVAMETFTIESVEPQPEEIADPVVEETSYEISPMGEFKASDLMTDVDTSAPSELAASLSNQSAAGPLSLGPRVDSKSEMQFCGVDGGGNHFVYLIDSSQSMHEAFDSARREMLHSIDLLTEQQRFYVVLYDSQPAFMRINDPRNDEPSSVYATQENKNALRRWAMQVSQERGKNPGDVLEFSLKLKPDVIFLLSDGSFPEFILTMLQEQNRIDNLFGETKPISIVHTIGYYSKEGASIMSRIAKQNNGQYRYVPKP